MFTESGEMIKNSCEEHLKRFSGCFMSLLKSTPKSSSGAARQTVSRTSTVQTVQTLKHGMSPINTQTPHHFQALIHVSFFFFFLQCQHIWQILIVIVVIVKVTKQTLKTDKFSSHQSRIQILYLYPQKVHVTTSFGKKKEKKKVTMLYKRVSALVTMKCSPVSVCVCVCVRLSTCVSVGMSGQCVLAQCKLTLTSNRSFMINTGILTRPPPC